MSENILNGLNLISSYLSVLPLFLMAPIFLPICIHMIVTFLKWIFSR